MARQEYSEVPAEAPKPRLWKCLGQIVPGLRCDYALAKWGAKHELDVDREAELRMETSGMLDILFRHYEPEAISGKSFVRYATKSWPELVVRFEAYTIDDYAGLSMPKHRRN